jgi:hypothetical protein
MHLSRSFTMIFSLIIAGCQPYAERDMADTGPLASVPMELTTHLGQLSRFEEGMAVQFLLSLGQGAYLYMYHVDADHTLRQLVPPAGQAAHYYEADYYLAIPDHNVIIDAPFGQESIWVFASDRGLSDVIDARSIETIEQSVREHSSMAFGSINYAFTTVKSQK